MLWSKSKERIQARCDHVCWCADMDDPVGLAVCYLRVRQTLMCHA